jgi:putative transposase
MVYRSRRPPQEALRRRVRELAAVQTSYGYRRLHVLLRREGWLINHKRVQRIYGEEGLGLKRKKPKRRRAAVIRRGKPEVTRPNQRWAMDFMLDTLCEDRSLRMLTVIDVFTRECLALEAGRRFTGERVAEVLGHLVSRHGKPQTIQCDQGPEFTSLAMDHWAYWNQVELMFGRPGTPGDNARNEAFNSLVRRECLTHHYFLDLKEAAAVLHSWKEEYNNDRPHGSLGQSPPAQYRAGWSGENDPARLQNVR